MVPYGCDNAAIINLQVHLLPNSAWAESVSIRAISARTEASFCQDPARGRVKAGLGRWAYGWRWPGCDYSEEPAFEDVEPVTLDSETFLVVHPGHFGSASAEVDLELSPHGV